MILKENWKAIGNKDDINKHRDNKLYEIMKDRDNIYFYEPLIIKTINMEKKHMALSEYPNIKKSEEFNSIFSSHTNISGLPSTSDVYGKNSPTEITAILFEKDVFSNNQVARESVKILNDLISEHGYTFPKESYTGYQVKTIIEGSNIKVCLFVNADN
jgi:hypothetical protein